MISKKEELINGFEKCFGTREGVRVCFAPGRVNLIGEHTDYNGGHVFPCALTIGTYAAVKPRNDRKLRFFSANFAEKGIIETSLDELTYNKAVDWANYVCGVISVFEKRGYVLEKGLDFYCLGTIPNGSGLSSSASLEVLTAQVLKVLYGFEVDNINMALIGQEAENKYIGVNCGIMDQFAVACGKKDKAIFLDTATLDYQYVPVELEGIRIVIGNTCKKRGLGDSKYNERRAECEAALAKLQTVCNIKALGELTVEEFEKNAQVIGDEIKAKRARHAVAENIRTLDAVKALEAGKIAEFGKLMNASHTSLRDDYEVTGVELDTLVAAAWKHPATVGARMTGAGFGGCTVSLVKTEGVEDFIAKVGAEYKEKIGYSAEFYVVDIGEGPCEL